MNSRRSFFKRFAAAVAIVALAPQIAFKATLEKPAIQYEMDRLFQTLYEVKSTRPHSDTIDIFTDRRTAGQIQDAMARHYRSRMHA